MCPSTRLKSLRVNVRRHTPGYPLTFLSVSQRARARGMSKRRKLSSIVGAAKIVSMRQIFYPVFFKERLISYGNIANDF